MERTGGKKERNDEKEEEEGSKDGTQSERKHRGMHFARVYVRICMDADVYRCIPTCVGNIRRQKLCVGRIQCKRKDEEYDEDDGRVQGGRGGRKAGRDTETEGGRKRRRARKRRGEATAIPDFHFN